MADKSEMRILLLSTPWPFPGAQRKQCEICPSPIYEDPVNIKRAKDSGGYVVCLNCGLKLKKEFPDLIVQGQLWNGLVRVPEPIPELRWYVDLLSKRK